MEIDWCVRELVQGIERTCGCGLVGSNKFRHVILKNDTDLSCNVFETHWFLGLER